MPFKPIVGLEGFFIGDSLVVEYPTGSVITRAWATFNVRCIHMDEGKRPPNKTVTLKIPAELYRNLSGLIQNTGFRSVTEFAIHVLRDVTAGGKLDGVSSELPQREIRTVRERLQALGYID